MLRELSRTWSTLDCRSPHLPRVQGALRRPVSVGEVWVGVCEPVEGGLIRVVLWTVVGWVEEPTL